jgi:hypothetical protein
LELPAWAGAHSRTRFHATRFIRGMEEEISLSPFFGILPLKRLS